MGGRKKKEIAQQHSSSEEHEDGKQRRKKGGKALLTAIASGGAVGVGTGLSPAAVGVHLRGGLICRSIAFKGRRPRGEAEREGGGGNITEGVAHCYCESK